MEQYDFSEVVNTLDSLFHNVSLLNFALVNHTFPILFLKAQRVKINTKLKLPRPVLLDNEEDHSTTPTNGSSKHSISFVSIRE